MLLVLLFLLRFFSGSKTVSDYNIFFVCRGGILDTLADMKEKAEATLSDARTAEMKAQHASVALGSANFMSAEESFQALF